MLAEVSHVVQVFEAAMLVLFGVSWPVDILKGLRTKRMEGKSWVFLACVFVGYCSGVAAKVVAYAQDGIWQWVAVLYGLNGMMVAIDLGVYFRYRPRGVGI